MESYNGVATVTVKPWSEVEVTVDLVSGYVIIWERQKEKWLGSWPATEVSAEVIRGTRVLLTLGDEQVPFEMADPVALVSGIESATRYFLEMTVPERIKRAALIRTLPVRRRDALARWIPDGRSMPVRKGTDRAIAGPAEAADPPQGSVDARLDVSEREAMRSVIEPVQWEVIQAFQQAMESWFGFFFATGKGTGIQRLQSAISGLTEASHRLTHSHDRLGDLHDLPSRAEPLVKTYRAAVGGWAEAMSLLARGVELDQQPVVRDGLQLMVDAATIAEDAVLAHKGSGQCSLVKEILAYLAGVRPSAKVPKKAVTQAKGPWEKSIIAAGAPFDW